MLDTRFQLVIGCCLVSISMAAHCAPDPSQLVTPIHQKRHFDVAIKTDTSCNALLSDLSQYLQFPSNEVAVLHMTNYQAKIGEKKNISV